MVLPVSLRRIRSVGSSCCRGWSVVARRVLLAAVCEAARGSSNLEHLRHFMREQLFGGQPSLGDALLVAVLQESIEGSPVSVETVRPEVVAEHFLRKLIGVQRP